MSSTRLGRAFALHAFTGTLGFAASPVVIGAVAAFGGWRLALMAAGLFGLLVTLGLAGSRAYLAVEPGKGQDAPATRQGGKQDPAGFARVLLMPIVLLAFAYFVMTAFAGAGIQSFSITALTQGYGTDLALATLAVTAYQLGSCAGILLGGVLADRTEHHHRVAMVGLAVAAALILAAAQKALPIPVIIALLTGAGFAGGATAPSRDVLVRRAAPKQGLGKVFGIVYSGFDIGNLVAPLVYGALLDRHLPNLVFVVAAGAFALATLTVLGVGRRSSRDV